MPLTCFGAGQQISSPYLGPLSLLLSMFQLSWLSLRSLDVLGNLLLQGLHTARAAAWTIVPRVSPYMLDQLHITSSPGRTSLEPQPGEIPAICAYSAGFSSTALITWMCISYWSGHLAIASHQPQDRYGCLCLVHCYVL